MPSLGADMDAGTITEWRVKPGDEVHRGDIVAVVETEKSTIEVEVFENGVIDEILVEAGERVPVGTALARLSAFAPTRARVGSPTAAATATETATEAEAEPEFRPKVPAAARMPGPAEEPHVVSPVLRHLADHLAVDLATVRGTGLGGTVTRADVERAAKSPRSPAEGRVRSSPLARRVAAELGVDLATVTGTGPGGSVSEGDVRLAASRRPPGATVGATVEAGPPPARAAETPATRVGLPEPAPSASAARQLALRKAIGALMARSKREVPHYYLSTTIDMRSAAAWLERTNAERSVTDRIVMPVLLLKATALAVREVPEMNGFMVEGEFVPASDVHLGVAVSLRSGGVIAPAIHHVGQLGLPDLMAALRDLVGRARRGVLRSSEMSDPTITVTNLGDLGVETVFGVIYPPQVALVGFGRVSPRPWAVDGMLGVAPCVTATLSADHRASDGHRGGLFLAEIDRLLQEPERLQ
jgi:pyruvate dehydrogenase E2 component (dihydrolipoamide acetyltransferase)